MVNAREGEVKRGAGLLCAAAALLLAGCNPVTGPSACPLPGQARMTSLKPSVIVETVGTIAPERIAKVIKAYRTSFHQISVGQVSENVCAVF
jgi:hypothetical protein